MTTVIRNLHARKEKLIAQLGATENADRRDEIQRQLEQINTALDFLDRPKPPPTGQ
jgi:hypothetical protein